MEKKTDVDLNAESNDILFNIDKIGDLELSTTAFGQRISVSLYNKEIYK